MRVAFIFPGQGSQAVGMGQDLASDSSSARDVIAAADNALNEQLSTLMFEGPADRLTLTANAQPALLSVSMAALKALEHQLGRRLRDVAAFVAGHSLGEYTALTAAGTFDFAEAVRLVRRRGEAMQAAVPPGQGAMAAILGLDHNALPDVLSVAGGDDVLAVANDNAGGQIVISGTASAVEQAMAAAKQRGAKRALSLPVSAPFHSPLMEPAARDMAVALDTVSLRDPEVPVVANTLAGPVTDAATVRAQLVAQVCGTVRWRETMAFLKAEGVTHVFELGAGKVLTGLAKRAIPDAVVRSVGTMQEVEEAAAALAA